MTLIKNPKPLEVLIFGAGAVGSIFGWRLAQNPHVQVSAVCRSNYEIVKSQGLKMRTSTWGNGHFRPHRTVQRARELRDVNFDYIVCAQKANHDQNLPDLLHEVVRPSTTLVTAQNGIGIEKPLLHAFPNTLLSSICYVGCQQSSGIVEQVAQIRPYAFQIGNCNTSDQDKLRQFVGLDPMFEANDDIEVERWTKLIFNGSWNPISALTDSDTHQIAKSGDALSLIKLLAEEIYQVAAASGKMLPEDLPSKVISSALSTAAIIPSMLQDLRQGKSMEIEPICGNIWRQADRIGVAVPIIKATYEKLRRLNESLHLTFPPPEIDIPLGMFDRGPGLAQAVA